MEDFQQPDYWAARLGECVWVTVTGPTGITLTAYGIVLDVFDHDGRPNLYLAGRLDAYRDVLQFMPLDIITGVQAKR